MSQPPVLISVDYPYGTKALYSQLQEQATLDQLNQITIIYGPFNDVRLLVPQVVWHELSTCFESNAQCFTIMKQTAPLGDYLNNNIEYIANAGSKCSWIDQHDYKAQKEPCCHLCGHPMTHWSGHTSPHWDNFVLADHLHAKETAHTMGYPCLCVRYCGGPDHHLQVSISSNTPDPNDM